MFKEYYYVLLIMDKLFNSWHITNTEIILLGNKHNGVNCWTTKMDTFYYLEGSGLSGINSRDVVVLGKDFIWVGTWQTQFFKEYYGVLLIMD